MREINPFTTLCLSAVFLASCGAEGNRKDYACSVKINAGGGITEGVERFAYFPDRKIVQKQDIIEGKQIPVDLPATVEGDHLKFKTRELVDPFEFSMNLKSMEISFSKMVRDTPDGDLALTGFGACKAE